VTIHSAPRSSPICFTGFSARRIAAETTAARPAIVAQPFRTRLVLLPAAIVLAGPERKSKVMNSIPTDCCGERIRAQRQLDKMLAM
jgi:hypothetical protein